MGAGVFWLGIFAFGEVFFSGYHLRDDHQQILMHTQLMAGHSVVDVAGAWISQEEGLRFRPFMILAWVIRTAVFGLAFSPQFFMRYLEVVFATLLGVRVARQLGLDVWGSVASIMLTLVGATTMIWFLLGIPESLAFLLFMISLTLMLSDSKGESSLIGRIGACLSLILAALTKESFILIIPAFLLLRWAMTRFYLQLPVLKSIRRRWLEDGVLVGVMMALLLWVSLRINVAEMGPYGIDSVGGSQLFGIFKTTLYLFVSGGIGFGILAVLLLAWRYGEKRENTPVLFPFWYLCAVIVALIVPQIILYAKSGMFERYLIPARWGMALLLVSITQYIQTRYQFSVLTDRVQLFYKRSYVTGGIVLCMVAVLVLLFSSEVLLLLGVLRQQPVQMLWLAKLQGMMVVLILYGFFLVGVGWKKSWNRGCCFRQIWIWGILPTLFVLNTMYAFGSARIFAKEGYAIQDLGARASRLPDTLFLVIDPVAHAESGVALKTYLEHLYPAKKMVLLHLEDLAILGFPKQESGPFAVITFPGYAQKVMSYCKCVPIDQTITSAGYLLAVHHNRN